MKNGPQQIVKMRTQIEAIARYVAAAMSVLTLSSAICCVTIKEYVGLAVLGILAVVFIAIAVGYPTIKVKIGKLLATITKDRENGNSSLA